MNLQARGNCTPLHLAAMLNHAPIAHRLLIAGAIEMLDSKGRTPLHHAADAGSTDVINLLGEVSRKATIVLPVLMYHTYTKLLPNLHQHIIV